MQQGQPTCEPTPPHPPRFWWLKRLTVVGIIAAGLLTVGRWQWGRHVQGLVDAQVAAWQAAGEPVRAEDFAGPALPDGQNAAWFIREAMRQYQPPPADDQMDLEYGWSYGPGVAAAHLRRNPEPLRLLREARARPAVSWKDSSRGLITQWPGAMSLGPLLRVAAMVDLQNDDESAAVEHVLDLLHLADALGQWTDREASSCSCDLLDEARETTARIVLRMNSGARPASAGQLRQLSARLHDDRRTTEQLMRVLCAERALVLSGTEAQAVAPFLRLRYHPPSWLQKAAIAVVRPATQMQQLRSARDIDRMIACLRADDWPGTFAAANVRLGRFARNYHYLHTVERVECGMAGWHTAKLVTHHHRLAIERAEVAAAVQMLQKMTSARQWLSGLAARMLRPPSGAAATQPSGTDVPDDQDGKSNHDVKPRKTHDGQRRADEGQ